MEPRYYHDSQQQYLAGLAEIAQGVLNEEVETGTLYATKRALYWWSARFIKTFSTIYHNWHITLQKWIHHVASEFQLPITFKRKNDLTDIELQTVMQSTVGVDNAKEHYAAWLLFRLTDVHLGSITASPRYSATDTSYSGKLRGVDETLHWPDIKWFQDEGRVCFRLTLRFLKAAYDSYKEHHIDST
jgi:hypothetical protein